MTSPVACVHYRVPYADTDQMRVVYYANYLVYFERARNELLRVIGFPYRDIEARGYALPVLHAQIDYKGAARYDDDLEIRAWVGWVKPVRLRVDCTVSCGGVVLAEGHTVHAFVTLATLKPTRVPADIAACLGAAGGTTA
ncbi:MAG: acyl-CoA thioesterase [Lentisphaerae bacterium]|nr:acyl-CoA thioesterase [Lentisphaerota bacterium]